MLDELLKLNVVVYLETENISYNNHRVNSTILWQLRLFSKKSDKKVKLLNGISGRAVTIVV